MRHYVGIFCMQSCHVIELSSFARLSFNSSSRFTHIIEHRFIPFCIFMLSFLIWWCVSTFTTLLHLSGLIF